MKSRTWKRAGVSFGLIVIVAAPVVAHAADPDWKAVEQALGKSGQLQPGDVFRVGMPRTDLAVTVKGVPVKAGFALGSYAAFKRSEEHTSELQSRLHLVCRLLLEKKKTTRTS